MAAFNFHRRKTRRWWYVGTTLVVAAFFAAFFVTSSAALNNSPSNFEAGDGNMTLGTSGNTDWNCFQGTTGFQSTANYGGTLTKADCNTTTGASNNSAPNPDFEQTPGQKFDTACPTFKIGNNPPKDVWSDVAQYLEASPSVNSDGGHDLYFYGASIRPVVNGNSSGNIYFSQGTNPNGPNCRTVGDVLLTFDFLGGGSKPTFHILTWQKPSGTCFVGSDSPTTGCWGPSSPPTITGDNSDGLTNSSQINGSDNALNGQNVLANGFSEIGVNLTQAIKQAGGSATCFANEAWVSRSSGSSFTSSPEMVVIDQQPTCGTINVIKHTLDGSGNRTGVNKDFGYTAGGLTPTTFTLNDANGATGDVLCTYNSSGTVTNAPCNKQRYSLVQPGTYTVTENAEPANFAPGSPALSCTVDSSGSGTSQSVSGEQATITLGISGVVTCTYVNQQQLGALRINKASIKSSTAVLQNAKFYVCTNASPTTTNCTAPTPVGASSAISEPQSTDSNGTICIANLPFATYHVFESAAPSGYAIDDSTVHNPVVNSEGDCSSSSSASATLNFTDTPLTDLSVEAKSEAAGGTKSTITCVNSTSSTAIGSGGSLAEDSKWSDTGVKPDTYTCTIVVDP